MSKKGVNKKLITKVEINNAIVFANDFITRSLDEQHYISKGQLQNLVYLTYGFYSAVYEKAPFDARFFAKKEGIEQHDIALALKDHQAIIKDDIMNFISPIKNPNQKCAYKSTDTAVHTEILDLVWERYGKVYLACQLHNLVTAPGSPYAKARQADYQINHQSIVDYFNGNAVINDKSK
ncbi:MAG: hypothetical protein FWD32_00930 [Firmicutes bacterium]|nr:hypothetical protein [Bacillota bacterium]